MGSTADLFLNNFLSEIMKDTRKKIKDKKGIQKRDVKPIIENIKLVVAVESLVEELVDLILEFLSVLFFLSIPISPIDIISSASE